jgi:hypothetical protein
MQMRAVWLLVMLLLTSGPALADDFQMNRLETNDLDLLYFDPPETYLTPYVARSYLNSLEFQEKVFAWKPWEKTTILLKDLSDFGNAGARASPNNAIIVDIAPLNQSFETFSAGERIFTLMNHEPVHVATMDAWNSEDAFWRNVFHGKPIANQKHPESILYNYLTAPRTNVPRWLLEGSAVFFETWMGGGIGRAQGGYDEMVFRAMVRDDAHFFDPLGIESEGIFVDFQGGVNAYLYGARFMSYLALTRGPEKLIEWLKRPEGSNRYYATDFERVYGMPLDAVWAEWIAWEHKFQRENLTSVQQFPTTPTHRLVTQGLGSVSRSYLSNNGTLIGGFRYPGVIAHVGEMSLSDGHIRRLTDIKGPMLYDVTSLAYDPQTNTAWYTTDNYAFRDLMQLNVATGEKTMLQEDSRVGDLAFNAKDRTLWGLRHLNGFSTLVRMEAPYSEWHQVFTWPYTEVPFDIDISPDGQYLSTSMGKVNGDQSIRVYRLADLMAGQGKEISQFSFGTSVPEGFVFSPDGRYLYGSAYYTGVSNIYRYEIQTGKTEAVSNAVTGFFRPIPREDGSLIVYEYTGQGFLPVTIEPKPTDNLGTIKFMGNEVVKAHPIVKTYAVGSPSHVPLDSLITNRGMYVPRDELRLASVYPMVQGYKSHPSFGGYALFADPMEFNRVTVNLGYSPSERLRPAERWHLDTEYKTIDWSFRYWHNVGDFYDLFGPTERSRKGDAFLTTFKRALIYDTPRELDFEAKAAYYMGLDTLPGEQNVQAGVKNIFSQSAALHFTDTSKSQGSVDHELGYEWDLAANNDYAKAENHVQVQGGLNFGFPLDWTHASLWSYSAVGAAAGDRNDPLTYFYFGGFKNNYVDDKEVKRYREFDTFPGFTIDEISARNFVREMAEFNLPPLRFEDVGTPTFFLQSLRPAVFAGMLWVDPGSDATERMLGTIGAQLDLNFTLAHRLPMVFSIGYAAGIEDKSLHSDEWMISLKIM